MVCSEQSTAGLRPLGSLSSDYRESRTYVCRLSGRYSRPREARISNAHIGDSRRCRYSLSDQGLDEAQAALGTPWVLFRGGLSTGNEVRESPDSQVKMR